CTRETRWKARVARARMMAAWCITAATPPLRVSLERVLCWTMKVSFTAKEYARLLELVHLGLWVSGARPDDPATTPERFAAISQKAFALAEPLGCADL